MFKKVFLIFSVLIIALNFIFLNLTNSALETQLLVDVSTSSDNVPYTQTQWYGFNATAEQGYCAILTSLTGNSDAYLFDTDFNLVGFSKNSGTTEDKVWYGGSVSGPMHIACFGADNPSSNFTIQVITAPYVKDLSPNTGSTGTLVTLTGLGFGATRGTSYVKFGTVTATNYSSWTNTEIKVYVPSGVASGTIQAIVYVTSKASNPKDFTASSISSNTTMWRYDLARTGNYPDGPNTFPLNLKWTYTTAKVNTMYSTSPVIVNGTLYIASGASDSKLYAFDATTGALKWSYTTGNQSSRSSPAIANGIVYIAASWYTYVSPYGYYTGRLYALDANTGAVKWSFTTDKTEMDGSPLVENGLVYIGTRVGKFYCLDATNGNLKWVYDIGNSGLGILGSPTFNNNTVYFIGQPPYYASALYALDASTGVLKWKTSIGLYVYTTPAIYNNTVFVNTANELRALDAQTGVLKWKYVGVEPSGYGRWSSPAVAEGIVYACLGTYNIYALDATTGSLRWSYRTGYQMIDSSPAVSNNIVYLSAGLPLYAFDATTGEVKWSYNMGPSYSSAGISNGRVYIAGGSTGNTLYCFGQ